MKKKELLTTVAQQTGLELADVEVCISGLVALLESRLDKQLTTRIPGIGTITTVNRKARRYRNPQSGMMAFVGEQIGVRIRPAANLTRAAMVVDPLRGNPKHQKARKLANTLVSDLKLYQADPNREAIQSGTLGDSLVDQIERVRSTYLANVDADVLVNSSYLDVELESLGLPLDSLLDGASTMTE